MTIPEKIKAARVAVGLSQREVGQACGYAEPGAAQTYVARWEKGQYPVPLDKIRPLAKVLCIPIDELIP